MNSRKEGIVGAIAEIVSGRIYIAAALARAIMAREQHLHRYSAVASWEMNIPLERLYDNAMTGGNAHTSSASLCDAGRQCTFIPNKSVLSRSLYRAL